MKNIILLILAVAVMPMTTFGAGVTILTHGLDFDAACAPINGTTWLRSMQASIYDNWLYTHGETVTLAAYIQITDDNCVKWPGGLEANILRWDTENSNSNNNEILILLDWEEASRVFVSTDFPYFGYNSTQSVASLVVEFILDSINGNRPLAELPIHLIGHSRGGALVCELARLLGEKGLWVEQVTTLDPHPLSGSISKSESGKNMSLAASGSESALLDNEPIIYENVLFADNYYQEHYDPTDPNGQSVQGAYNRYLEHDSIIVGGKEGKEHYNVHLWYHGTIDTRSDETVSDGDYLIPPDLRSTWYIDNESGGIATGFRFSQIAERSLGSIRNTAFQPITSGGSVRTGYSKYAGGLGSRTSVEDKSAAAWPNLLELTVYNGATKLDTGNHVLELPASLDVDCMYSCYHSSSNITLLLDTDLNPYNGFADTLISKSATVTSTVNTIRLSPSISVQGEYYICAMITDDSNGNTRYLYAKPLITFQDGPLPDFFVSSLSGQNGGVDPSGTIVVPQGSAANFVANPDPDFEVEYWYLDGSIDQVGGNTYTIPNVQANHSVDVTFRLRDDKNITLLAPNGGEQWFSRRDAHIAWNWEGNVGGSVKIDLLKGGVLNTPIEPAAANTGSYLWSIPDGQSNGADYRVRISSLDGSVADISDGDFMIEEPRHIDTVKISNVTDLQNMSTGGAFPRNAYYLLMNDIDASTITNFRPIGTDQQHYFRGTFDGQGYTINELNINRPTESYIGLFSVLMDVATVKNLNIIVRAIAGLDHVGAFAGECDGTILNCNVFGIIDFIAGKGGSKIGGLVGSNEKSGIIRNCSVNTFPSEITAESSPYSVGGIAGSNVGRIEWCWTAGNIYAGSSRVGNDIGALVGTNGFSVNEGLISECYSQMTDVLGKYNTGGLVGLHNAGSIVDCYFDSIGYVGSDLRGGGIAGQSTGGTLERCYVNGEVYANSERGALVGAHNATLSNSYWNREHTGIDQAIGSGHGTVLNCLSKTTAELTSQATFVNWDFDNVWSISEGNSPPVLRGIGDPLSVPTSIVASTDQSDGVHLFWSPLTYSTSNELVHDAVYRVLRSDVPDVTAPRIELASWRLGNSFIDSTAIFGATHYYWVKAAATNKGARESEFSSFAEGQRTFPPAETPTGVMASDSLPNSVLVEWNGVSNANYYRVYRSNSVSGSKDSLGSWQTGLSYVDIPPQADTIYYYWVAAAVDSFGNRISGYGGPDSGYYIVPDNSPPTISTSIIPEFPIETQSVFLHVSATDNVLLKRISLYWSIGNGQDSVGWDSVDVQAFDTSHPIGVYSAGDTITYWGKASDGNNNNNESEHRTVIVGSEQVTTPSRPQGPLYLRTVDTGSYTTYGSVTNLDDLVQYRFDWGDSTSQWGDSSAEMSWSSDGIKMVMSQARSANDTTVLSRWSVTLAVTVDSKPPIIITDSIAWFDTTLSDSFFIVYGNTADSVPSSGIDTTTISTGDPNFGNVYDWVFGFVYSVGVNRIVVTSSDSATNTSSDSIEFVLGCCIGLRGDYDGDGIDARVADLTYLIDRIFRGGSPALCSIEADMNNDGTPSGILDLTFLIDNIFRGGRVSDLCWSSATKKLPLTIGIENIQGNGIATGK